MTTPSIEEVARRVEAAKRSDNALDVLIEIALFAPCKAFSSARANFAGTKVIYTTPEGDQHTAWAWDWTAGKNRAATLAKLRAHLTAGSTHDR